MCYAHPGPRCSGHMLLLMQQHIELYNEHPTPENKARMKQSVENFLRTPEGIKRLREEGGLFNILLARRFERERKAKIMAYHASKNRDMPVSNVEVVSYQMGADNLLHSANGEPSLVLSDGRTAWHKEGKLHREDGPALINTNHNGTGTTVEAYYHEGELHRDEAEGPAWENKDSGEAGYYRHGKLHRDNGPAVIHGDGKGGLVAEIYYQNDKRHRVDGPAEVRYEPDGTLTEMYYIDGVRHREDGPAISVRNGLREEYYQYGKRHRVDGPAMIRHTKDGVDYDYYQNGKVHREDGPAVIRLNGRREEYYQDGKHHRVDGPAVIYRTKSGVQNESYYQNGELHREDGPAVIDREHGRTEWFMHGKPVSAPNNA